MGKELGHRLLKRRNVWETMGKLWKENMVSKKVKRKLYERIEIPSWHMTLD